MKIEEEGVIVLRDKKRLKSTAGKEYGNVKEIKTGIHKASQKTCIQVS